MYKLYAFILIYVCDTWKQFACCELEDRHLPDLVTNIIIQYVYIYIYYEYTFVCACVCVGERETERMRVRLLHAGGTPNALHSHHLETI